MKKRIALQHEHIIQGVQEYLLKFGYDLSLVSNINISKSGFCVHTRAKEVSGCGERPEMELTFKVTELRDSIFDLIKKYDMGVPDKLVILESSTYKLTCNCHFPDKDLTDKDEVSEEDEEEGRKLKFRDE